MLIVLGYSTDDFVCGIYGDTSLLLSKTAVSLTAADATCVQADATWLADPDENQVMALMELGSKCP